MIVFDFDGVLMDSVDEAGLTAFNTATDSRLTKLDQLPAGYLENFRIARAFVRGAGELVCIGKILASSARPASREECDRAFQQQKSQMIEFHDQFFAIRDWLRDSHSEAWCRLNHPFEPLWSFVRSIPVSQCAILTNKDRAATQLLLEYYGIVIPSNQISTGEASASTWEGSKVMRFNQMRSSLSMRDPIFIEDALKTLIEMKQQILEPIDLVLAEWGYLAESDTQVAAQHQISVLSQEGLIEKLANRLKT